MSTDIYLYSPENELLTLFGPGGGGGGGFRHAGIFF